MASKYDRNRWELYNPNIPNEDQPHSFITKRKLEKMEKGIEDANVTLEIGEVSMGDTFHVSITEDPTNKTRKLNITFPPAGRGEKGQDGKSAYQIWLDQGHTGSEQEFLDYLKGKDGKDGQDGKDGADGEQGPAGESAYQLWLNQGNTGSIDDFLNSLKGKDGVDGKDGQDGTDGINGKDGEDGEDGKSAYQLWLDAGNTGTEEEFLMSLKGTDGKDGTDGVDGKDGVNGKDGVDGKDGTDGKDGEDGQDGKSAYQLWLDAGNTGTEEEFLMSLKGTDGSEGKSAYDLWKLIPGNENKTITEFFESLKGEPGSSSGAKVEFLDF